ncbi:cation:proton antiporter [Candidatus Uhrbacteria bacterium]|nr:cation:proton antiporter [Candidatus Uhrbacteria bacterium]
MPTKKIVRVLFLSVFSLVTPSFALASGTAAGEGHADTFPLVFLFLVGMLLFARIGALVERWRQPAVLGELLMGVLLGTLAFAPGLHWIGPLKEDAFIKGIAEIGVILLLFRTGLESNVREMMKVGVKAFIVACVGVALPFIGGYFLSKLLLPGHSFETYLFIGATLTATSVGITARVFKDLDVLKSIEAKIVLGAAVIDDVLGLLILAVVAGIISDGSVSAAGIGILTLKAIAFLVVSIGLGQVLAPHVGRWFSKIHTGVGMKMTIALVFCAVYAYGASALAGLAPIVGAFAAGLVLDPVHFRAFSAPGIVGRIRAWVSRVADQGLVEEMHATAEQEHHAHVEKLIDGVSFFFVPIFFVYTGMHANLSAFADLGTVGIALAITAVAFLGKVLCGYAAGKGTNRLLVGFGMVPRGEVGLIFANVGKQLGVVDDRTFAIVLIVVVLTTLLTPPILGSLIRKTSHRE